MLPPDALVALDNLPPMEALHRPLDGDDTPTRRIAALLGNSAKSLEKTSVGDALFRWARTEPEALTEAEISSSKKVSEIVHATGRLPKRLGISVDFQRSMMAGEARLTGSDPTITPRLYMMSRLVAQSHDAQGCEARIGWAQNDPAQILINGLGFAVHDPDQEAPTVLTRPTFFASDRLAKISALMNNPLAYNLFLQSDFINKILPQAAAFEDVFYDGVEIFYCAGAIASAARIIMSRDTDALIKLAGFGSTAIAGELGHAVGHTAAVALFGLAGSWMVILAPVAAGLAGRVAARNLARRARFLLFCRNEVSELHKAISRHCIASNAVIEENLKIAAAQAAHLKNMHDNAGDVAKVVIADWLNRLDHIQSYRRLMSAKLREAAFNPKSLDRYDGDPYAAAHESIIFGARSGIHPANVSSSVKGVVSAVTALQKKMSLAAI
jgi:hypothetical protein